MTNQSEVAPFCYFTDNQIAMDTPASRGADRLSVHVSIFLLTAATLAWEITLTRIFAITQFYHFAFLAVNVALLGFGASGSVLSMLTSRGLVPQPGLSHQGPILLQRWLEFLSVAFALTLVGSYALINALPFDSYAIAWDQRQIWLLITYYLALTAPFFITGFAVGLGLMHSGEGSNRIYASNLLGSAAGALGAPLLVSWIGLPGIMAVIAAIALLAALAVRGRSWLGFRTLLYLAAIAVFMGMAGSPPKLAGLQLSPYKELSQALLYPEATIAMQRDGPVARTTIIESRGVRSLPGLSYQYRGPLPSQDGLFSDGDNLSPVIDGRLAPDWSFLDYLPESLAYDLRSEGTALVVHPRGGLAVWQALSGNQAQRAVVAVEPDGEIVRSLSDLLGPGSAYAQPGVTVHKTALRTFLASDDSRYTIIHLALAQPFRPITSGAYSLGEDYMLTVEAFSAYFDHLADDGILVFSRWLQTPPSESVRGLALLIEALERRGIPHTKPHIVGVRGTQIATFFVKLEPWTAIELQELRPWAKGLRFDLTLAPDLRATEINRYNILASPTYEEHYQVLVGSEARAIFFESNPFDVRPSRDQHPFFYHFFKWSQTPVVLQTWGQTWQPFGGSGILVLVALLMLATVASGFLILVPLLWGGRYGEENRRPGPGPGSRLVVALYFGALGLGFMLVEIPFIQRFILLLGHPTLAFALVLAGILFWSGIGSLLAPRFPWRLALSLLLACLILYAMGLDAVVQQALVYQAWVRSLLAFMLLAPLGVLLGMAFPLGLRQLTFTSPALVPWAWAINGCASVIGSVLAALLALQWGFTGVLVLGICCYGVALALTWLVGQGAIFYHSDPPPPMAQRELPLDYRP